MEELQKEYQELLQKRDKLKKEIDEYNKQSQLIEKIEELKKEIQLLEAIQRQSRFTPSEQDYSFIPWCSPFSIRM